MTDDRDRLLADMHSIELKVSIRRAERAQLIGPAGFLAHGLLLSADDPGAAGPGSRPGRPVSYLQSLAGSATPPLSRVAGNIPPLNNDLRGIR
jgi:hypothetical protein